MAPTKENEWIIWLFPEAGNVFLGQIVPDKNKVDEGTVRTRFCVLGKVKEEGNVGIWIEVDLVEERTIPDNKIVRTYSVSPKICLIKWDFISYVQRGERSEQLGFTQVSQTPRS